MGKLRGAWAGLSQMRGNFILSEFIFPRRVRLLRPQTSKVFGGYTREVVDWAPPHTKHSAVELNWGQHLSILQTNFESDFVVNATAAEKPTVNKSLKKSFIFALILAEFDPKKETWLEADSSGYAAGGALL